MSKNKLHMYLVSTPAVKKKYDMFYVFLCDGSIYEYKVEEINISIVDEFLEIEAKDRTMMESFVINSMMRMKFMRSTAKLVTNEKKAPDLSPVA
jgi:hypothetical protein